MSLHLYCLEASRSIRVAWLLEELALDYTVHYYPRQNRRAPPEFARESGSSLGRAPVLRDGDLVLAESGAICDYLLEKYDTDHKLLPTDPHQRAQTRMWTAAAEGTFALHGLAILYARWHATDRMKEKNESGTSDLDIMEEGLQVHMLRDLRWLESELSKGSGQYLVGDHITAADIMVSFSIQFIEARKLGIQSLEPDYPKTAKWLRALLLKDSFKAAAEKSKYSL